MKSSLIQLNHVSTFLGEGQFEMLIFEERMKSLSTVTYHQLARTLKEVLFDNIANIILINL